jgi:hypothetical protein
MGVIPMTYLDLAPAIAAIRSRPEEFEISNDALYHRRSRHRFTFPGEDDVRIEAACDCSLLRASSEQARAFHAAYRAWHASYWRPMAINREFASHFTPPALWRRLATRLLGWLLSQPPRATAPLKHAAPPLQAAD